MKGSLGAGQDCRLCSGYFHSSGFSRDSVSTSCPWVFGSEAGQDLRSVGWEAHYPSVGPYGLFSSLPDNTPPAPRRLQGLRMVADTGGKMYQCHVMNDVPVSQLHLSILGTDPQHSTIKVIVYLLIYPLLIAHVV